MPDRIVKSNLVVLTGLMTIRLGGSRVAAVIAALATIVMPVYLVMGSFYSMNAFEPLIWVTMLYLVIRLVQKDNMKLWLPIGVLMGLGLEMKHTMIVYGMALIAGMLLTPSRRPRFSVVAEWPKFKIYD